MITPLADLAKPIEGKDWLYYEADIREAHGGYAHTEARIFSADGTLLALSRQLVVVYDRRD
jgi:acyl-CoA thioesterase